MDEEWQNMSLYVAAQGVKLDFGFDNLWVRMEDSTCAVVCLTSNANKKAPSRGYSSLVYWFPCVCARLVCGVGHNRFLQRKEQSN
jgi:hypothetical protein